MASIDLLELRDRLERSGVLISFNGPLSESIITHLGDAVRRYLEEATESRARVTDVFSVFIEQTQNIRQYAAKRAADESESRRLSGAISVISQESDRYLVSSGNWVREADADLLSEHLDTLATLDQAALKKRYKQVLRTPRDADALTAGLGLIDMARKCVGPLDYTLRDPEARAGERYVFFSLQAAL